MTRPTPAPASASETDRGDPHDRERETGEAAFDGAAVVLLADGEDSGDTKATYMIPVTRGTDWCKWRDLRPSEGGSSPVMAAW